jgi:epoxyqueuosine reductase
MFKAWFRHTPLERTKRRGVLRNVCVAMGNSGNTAFIPLLETLTDDEEALIREHAAWALSRLRQTPLQGSVDATPGPRIS